LLQAIDAPIPDPLINTPLSIGKDLLIAAMQLKEYFLHWL